MLSQHSQNVREKKQPIHFHARINECGPHFNDHPPNPTYKEPKMDAPKITLLPATARHNRSPNLAHPGPYRAHLPLRPTGPHANPWTLPRQSWLFQPSCRGCIPRQQAGGLGADAVVGGDGGGRGTGAGGWWGCCW